MKKLLALLLTLAALFSLSACGASAPTGTSSEPPAASAQSAAAADEAQSAEPEADVPSAPYEITYSNFTTYSDSIGSVWGQAIVEITNTGSENLYLSAGSYDVKDESGSLVATESLVSVYPDVLQPGEKGYLYDETTFDDLSAEGTYEMTPHLSVESASIPCVRYEVFDTTLKSDDYGEISLIGQMTNTSDEDGSMVYAVVVLYDDANTPLGVLYTILDNDLSAGDTRGFEAVSWSLPPTASVDTIANYTVYAYPMQMQF